MNISVTIDSNFIILNDMEMLLRGDAGKYFLIRVSIYKKKAQHRI